MRTVMDDGHTQRDDERHWVLQNAFHVSKEDGENLVHQASSRVLVATSTCGGMPVREYPVGLFVARSGGYSMTSDGTIAMVSPCLLVGPASVGI